MSRTNARGQVIAALNTGIAANRASIDALRNRILRELLTIQTELRSMIRGIGLCCYRNKND